MFVRIFGIDKMGRPQGEEEEEEGKDEDYNDRKFLNPACSSLNAKKYDNSSSRLSTSNFKDFNTINSKETSSIDDYFDIAQYIVYLLFVNCLYMRCCFLALDCIFPF